ncbi:MAG: T9SS type A sorting domain-containing protein [Ignavibacteria bacterium]|nr:T9SS type A sorting domain-containing protein [Ignavibacteria bacterium]
MKHTIIFFTVLFFTTSILFSEENKPRTSIRGKIEEAYKSGKLSHDEYLLNLLYNIVDRTQLDKLFYEAIPGVEKCGTPTLMKLQKEMKSSSFFTQNEIETFLARPQKQKFYNTPEGKFRIHFDTTGTHAVYQPTVDINPQNGIPDYVDRTAEIFDRVWKFELDTLGYDSPAPDGTAGGGNNLYDIYMHRNSGAYGVTFTETFFPNYLGRGGWSSYIHVDPNFDGFGYPDRTLPMKVTAAHEFFHAVQFVYGYEIGSWLLEISSTWIEDIAYDAINDYYLYLNTPAGVFRAPHLTLETANGEHEYSAAVFGHCVSENFGVPAIKKIWEETIGQTSGLNAIDSAMRSYGSSLQEIFGTYVVWNYLTGGRANTSHSHYSEGSLYPQTRIHRILNSTTFDSTNEALNDIEHYGTYYISIVGDHSSGTFGLAFSDPLGNPYLGTVILDSANRFTSLTFDLSIGEGSVSIPHWENISNAIFIPASVAPFGGGFLFGYSGSFVPSGVDEVTLDKNKFSLAQNFPNPFNPKTVIRYSLFVNSVVSLKIFDILGREIAELIHSEVQGAGEHEIQFDATHLQSGIYFYRLNVSQQGSLAEASKLSYSETKKFTVMK